MSLKSSMTPVSFKYKYTCLIGQLFQDQLNGLFYEVKFLSWNTATDTPEIVYATANESEPFYFSKSLEEFEERFYPIEANLNDNTT